MTKKKKGADKKVKTANKKPPKSVNEVAEPTIDLENSKERLAVAPEEIDLVTEVAEYKEKYFQIQVLPLLVSYYNSIALIFHCH